MRQRRKDAAVSRHSGRAGRTAARPKVKGAPGAIEAGSSSAAPPIGPRLLALRQALGLTLEELAGLSGVSKSMLSQIERGRVNPTYARLWNITQALDVGIDELVDAADRRKSTKHWIEHLPARATPTIRSTDGLCTTLILSPIHAGLPVEWYEMILEPGGSILANAHGYGAWEHTTVIEGTVTVVVGDARYEVAEGETIRYSAEQRHGAMNLSDRRARCLLVVVARDELGETQDASVARRYGARTHGP